MPFLQVNTGKAYLNLGQDEKAMTAFDKATNLAAAPLAIEKNRLGLQNIRTIKLEKTATHTGTAEFFVLLEPAGSQSVVSAGRYISSDEQLKSLADDLKNIKYPLTFPDDVSTKVLRRGVVSCSTASGECMFVMVVPGDVRSID